MFDTIHEECGVFGIYENHTADVAASAYYALYALQHRGQESCGQKPPPPVPPSFPKWPSGLAPGHGADPYPP